MMLPVKKIIVGALSDFLEESKGAPKAIGEHLSASVVLAKGLPTLLENIFNPKELSGRKLHDKTADGWKAANGSEAAAAQDPAGNAHGPRQGIRPARRQSRRQLRAKRQYRKPGAASLSALTQNRVLKELQNRGVKD